MPSGYTDQITKNDWLNELDKPEVQESLAQLIKKLPDIQRSLNSVEGMLKFGQSVTEDSDIIEQFEEQLTYSSINQTNIEALIKLLGKLPMLLEWIEKLEQAAVFIENVLGDQESLETLFESLSNQPVVQQGKDTWSVVQTIKERVESTPQEQVSIFTVLKWIKDPNVQKSLRYIQTTMDVLNKKREA